MREPRRRCYLAWSAERGRDLLAAQRPHLELYIRSMQEIRRFRPSTVSRRFSVAAGFYRTCVIDGFRLMLPDATLPVPGSLMGFLAVCAPNAPDLRSGHIPGLAS